MFTSFHWWDLLPLLLLALLFFGPKRLPQMGSAIGETVKEFRKSFREIKKPEEDDQAKALPPANASTKPSE
ncbi:MAG TPA: twin-arginine translocase TatA/TatE family subunit [Ktedonobacterales bacterium]|nr:twin-arginine translocase TatA/TatE family subunit [Ktedonobacterales bacterium]